MTGEMGIDPACDPKGTGHFVASYPADTGQLSIKEPAIKRRIMGHQGIMAHKLDKSSHNLSAPWGTPHHRISDTGQALDKGTHRNTGIHQAVKASDDPVIVDENRADLNSPISTLGRQAGGLEIKDNNRKRTHGYP
jgi:hypothetical protein